MEFLGDSTLGHAIAEELYVNYPGREGNLTDIKIHYVEGNKLAKVAEEIELDNILLVGIGEATNEQSHKARNENAIEALIGAIDQDQVQQWKCSSVQKNRDNHIPTHLLNKKSTVTMISYLLNGCSIIN